MITKILLTSFLLFSMTAVSQSTDGLTAYYPFSGNANDESGFNNRGIVDNPILTTDRFDEIDNAYLFNGTDDIIRVLDNSQTHLFDDFTIMAWVNPYSIKSQTILRKGSAQSETPVLGAYSLSLSATNDYIFSVGTTTESVQVRFPGYLTNQWQFIVGVKEGNNLSLYIDGIKVNEEFITGVMGYDTSLFLIGTRLQLPSSTFEGKIDEIRIYDRALNENEIQNTLSVLENDLMQSINVHPNPFSKHISIQNLKPFSDHAFYKLFSMNGQLVKQGKLTFEKTIETANLPSGIYLLNINDDTKSFQTKMVKY